jgi:hypothetical protein
LFCCAVVCLLVNVLGARLLAQFPDETPVDSAMSGIKTHLAPGGVSGAGSSVAHAGDVNGDNVADLLIGADGEGAVPGRVFVVFGGRSGPLTTVLPGSPAGGVELFTGLGGGDHFGHFVAGAGDTDGDGIDDFLVGLPSEGHPDLPQGGVYLIFGNEHASGTIDLLARPSAGVLFTLGEPGGLLGLAGAGVGDVNGDGHDDFALGVPEGITTSPGGDPAITGKVFVIFGGEGLRSEPQERSLGSLDPAEGFMIPGVDPESGFGAALSAAGDLDNDGLDDLAIGAPRHLVNGSVFVIFGRDGLSAAPDLSAIDGSAAIELRSALPSARLGQAIAGGADATRDGLPDLLLGAPDVERGGGAAGIAYLFPGAATLRDSGVYPVPAATGVCFHGLRGSRTGSAVSFVPDLDESGYSEILIGAPTLRSGRGAAYLVYDGIAAGEIVFLEEVTPPIGAIFFANTAGTRLGSSVAGLPDRNADVLGDMALGAPGFPPQDGRGGGAVFEVNSPADPGSPVPRNLSARLLRGGRVALTWMISRVYDSLRVYRDGVPIGEELPGHILRFVDVEPGVGTHVYSVEADGDPALRSGLARVQVRALAVRELACRQIPGQLRMEVSWVAGDIYQDLLVLLDRSPVSQLLPPETTSFEFDVPPGDHVIEVLDPLGDSAACFIEIKSVPLLPSVVGFSCVLDGPRTARLSWQPNADYAAYLLVRNGVPVAKIEGLTEYLDDGVPVGVNRYELVGLNEEIHPGEPALCELIVPSGGVTVLSGRVQWRGGPTVKRGRVRVTGANANELPDVQVADSGDFIAPVPEEGPYTVTYTAHLKAAEPKLTPGPSGRRTLSVSTTVLSASGPVILELPPPIFLVSMLEPRVNPRTDAPPRWIPLQADLGSQALSFPILLPSAIARGALEIERVHDSVQEYLAVELGSRPPSIDLVAFGAGGLAARLHLASRPEGDVGKLVLLGTPNLGTERGHLEARAELTGRPLKLISKDILPAVIEDDGPAFLGGAEQTVEFLRTFNQKINDTNAADVHLVAGIGGLEVLDPILKSTSHDNRVSEESALGGFSKASTYRVVEKHEELGQGPESLPLLLDILFSTPEASPMGAGGGQEDDPSYPSSDIYTGILEPGGVGSLPLISDTSESIIILLNSELPGGIQFNIETPSGALVDPTATGALPGVDYQTYGDGEGHEVQAYKFDPGEIGTYKGHLSNPVENVAIQYTLESYIQSDLVLLADLNPEEIDLGESTEILATLLKNGTPKTGATVNAQLWRPNGELEILTLLDDGVGTDVLADDGVYSVSVTSGSEPGIHEVEISATGIAGDFTLYHREATTQLLVLSDAGAFAGGYTSGVTEAGDILAHLWVETSLEVFNPSILTVKGKLTDLNGNPVSEYLDTLEFLSPQTVTFRFIFSGSEIFAAQADGPYVLSEIELYDGGAGMVLADHLEEVHATAAHSWREFGITTPEFIRGDVNGDTAHDISDAIGLLQYLFAGEQNLFCLDAGNVNDDAELSISDAIYLLSHLFQGGSEPPSPYPGCGMSEKLGCDDYPACAEQ